MPFHDADWSICDYVTLLIEVTVVDDREVYFSNGFPYKIYTILFYYIRPPAYSQYIDDVMLVD